MTFKPIAAVLLASYAVLAGCATPVAEPIRAERQFNKMGEPMGCSDGFVLVTGTSYPATCVPDTGECDERPYYDANGNIIDPCPDPRRHEDRDPRPDPRRPDPQ